MDRWVATTLHSVCNETCQIYIMETIEAGVHRGQVRWPLKMKCSLIMGRKYTFEPKRCGIALYQVAFGAVLRAQSRAWPHRKEKCEGGRREEK